MFSLLADATAVVHITSIIAVVIGLLVAFRYKRFRPIEAGVLIAIVIYWSIYGNCPFTILEEYFRTKAGSPTGITNVGFLPYYANKLLGIEFSSRIVQNTTFFTGGALFASSIEWFAPLFHYPVFRKRRRSLRQRARN